MTGVFEHSIDAKGRLFIPSRLREELGEEFQIAFGVNHSLTIYPINVWDSLCDQADKLQDADRRKTMEMLIAYSIRCSADAQNRIMIPPSLREYAKLEKDVVVVGANRVVRIWEASSWHAKRVEILTPARLDDLDSVIPL